MAWAVLSDQAAGDLLWSPGDGGAGDRVSVEAGPRAQPGRPFSDLPSQRARAQVASGVGKEQGQAVKGAGPAGPPGVQRSLGGRRTPGHLLSSLWRGSQWRLTCRDAQPLLLPDDAWPGDAQGRAGQQHLLLRQGPDHARQWLHHGRGCKGAGSQVPGTPPPDPSTQGPLRTGEKILERAGASGHWYGRQGGPTSQSPIRE